MRRMATAFSGAALFVGGLDISPTFAAEKPQTSTGPSIDPIAPNAGPPMGTYLRSPQYLEAIASVVPVDVVHEDGEKPDYQFNSETDAGAGRPGRRRGALIWLGNAHEFRRAITTSPMEDFTTSRRKFSKHFS
jgi:hypothetical protein